jgi:RNA polymerase sigma factor (sigma-70 family)
MGESFSQEDERRRALMDAIFREHFIAVRRYISHKVSQPDAVDDLTSQVFLKAFRWLREDRGVGQVRSWLYATARTMIAEYWQEQQKSLFLPLESIEDSAVVLCAPQDDEQTQQHVYHLLHLLPERERQVLILRYFQGYSTAEVGQELGLNVGHVRVVQLRALRHAALLEVKERSLSPMPESTNEPITIYTEQGQRVLDLAREEALSFNHHYIGTEHLLLGILSEASAAASLIEQGATLSRLRAELLSVVGKDEPDPRAGAPFTPRSQRILEMAGKIAGERGETAISPEHILQAVVSEKQGIAVQMLRLMGVNLASWLATEEKPSPEKNEQYIRRMEQKIAQYPQLDEEEERRLAHLVARGRAEQRRAELLKEAPDPHLVSEGNDAYFRLTRACQHLVLSVSKGEEFSDARCTHVFEPGVKSLSAVVANKMQEAVGQLSCLREDVIYLSNPLQLFLRLRAQRLGTGHYPPDDLPGRHVFEEWTRN